MRIGARLEMHAVMQLSLNGTLRFAQAAIRHKNNYLICLPDYRKKKKPLFQMPNLQKVCKEKPCPDSQDQTNVTRT